MDVGAVSSGGTTVAGTASTGLDKNQFLNLLITQIRNQDPLSPMDNQQFISQLTEFTNLEVMQEISGKMDDNMGLTESLNNTMMLGLVGRSVTVEGEAVEVRDGEPTGNQVQVNGPATATIVVRDAAGNEVATYTRNLKYGVNDIGWDGRRADGQSAADGNYELEITVADAEGVAQPFASFMTAPVDGIRYQNGLAVVEVAGLRFSVGEIYEVRQ